MNSIWNKNIALFTERFPALAQRYTAQIAETGTHAETEQTCASYFSFWKLSRAKNGSMTASENGMILHSAYNPEREAEGAVKKAVGCSAGVFCGFGLGYGPSSFAAAYPGTPLILIEPDLLHLFASFAFFDWTTIFSAPNLIIVSECPAEAVMPLIEQYNTSACAVFSVKAQTIHARQYFETLSALIVRNKRKDDINTATLERFARLWMRNSCRNMKQTALRSGVCDYAGKAADNNGALPFLVIAAGPSLAEILPDLRALHERAITVCVDTALRACISAGVEPDFIVLTDPQYYAYRHIAGLASPSSVLITESAVTPAVFRFPCRRIVLCSSLFPLGKLLEKTFGTKGDLGAGGSVASCAWNFAQLAGAREIFTTGLDLAYPGKQTHIRGSTYEQAIYAQSDRTFPAESANVRTLYAASAEIGTTYANEHVLTDARMKMFAWWFESRIASYPEIKTFTFSKSGLRIPGIIPVQKQTLLDRPSAAEQKKLFFKQSERHTDECESSQLVQFEKMRGELITSLESLYCTARSGFSLCYKALEAPGDRACTALFPRLAEIDRTISESNSKEIVSLVFPTERQLTALFASDPIIPRSETSAARVSVEKSLVVYRELCHATNEYREEIEHS